MFDSVAQRCDNVTQRMFVRENISSMMDICLWAFLHWVVYHTLHTTTLTTDLFFILYKHYVQFLISQNKAPNYQAIAIVCSILLKPWHLQPVTVSKSVIRKSNRKVWIILQYGYESYWWDFQLRCNLLSVQTTNKHNKAIEGTPWNSHQTTWNKHRVLLSDALPVPVHFPN